MQVIKKYN